MEIIEIGLRKKEEEIKENDFEFISFLNFLEKHLTDTKPLYVALNFLGKGL